MIDKKYLDDYLNLSKEIADIRRRISDIDNQLKGLASDTVKDKVYGGEGGLQGFVIEGFPAGAYNKKKTLLLRKRKRLIELEYKVFPMIDEVDKFINDIDDPYVRMIGRMRYLDGLSWIEVAQKMGGNTEDSVRKAFSRYMEKNN